MIRIWKVIFAQIVLSHAAFAAELGTRAMIFQIKEEGFIEMIIKKLKTIDLAKENAKLEVIMRDKIENPSPIMSVMPARGTREFLVDPSYVLKEDIKLPCGKVLFLAGTKVNPLDHMDLGLRVFFIDGRIRDQTLWLKEKLEQMKKATNEEIHLEPRIVLIGGSPMKLQEELGCTVYFDQHAEIVERFSITASPATLEQSGKLLKITEINIKGE
jgi:conjugal transfer pilus assembly protein TraW